MKQCTFFLPNTLFKCYDYVKYIIPDKETRTLCNKLNKKWDAGFCFMFTKISYNMLDLNGCFDCEICKKKKLFWLTPLWTATGKRHGGLGDRSEITEYEEKECECIFCGTNNSLKQAVLCFWRHSVLKQIPGNLPDLPASWSTGTQVCYTNRQH